MAKTEVEILQVYKDYATAKKLSVSEITMQKRAAKIASLALADEAIEQTLIDADLEFFDVAHANIRDERAKQKKEDEALLTNPKPKEKPDTAPKENSIEEKLNQVMKELETLKNQDASKTKRTLVLDKVFEKGANKKDKELIEELLSLQNINHETDEEVAADAIVAVYNKAKSFVKPEKKVDEPDGGEGFKELEKIIEGSKQFTNN